MRVTAVLLALCASFQVVAQEPVPLITNPPVQVTSDDFEAFLLRIPPDYRAEVRASFERIGKSVDQVYANRVLAAEAVKLGQDKDPLIQLRLRQIREAYLATLWGENFRKSVKVPDFSKRVEELYRINKSRFTEAERITGSFLFVSLSGRTRDAALERARALRAQAIKGDSFAELIATSSDDTNARKNQGRLDSVSSTEIEKPLADAAFALQAPGQISEPVETKTGFFLVRLEKKAPAFTRPFADVKALLLEEEESKFRDVELEKAIGRLKNTPQTIVHEKNIESLRKELDQAEITRLHREAAKAGAKQEGAR